MYSKWQEKEICLEVKINYCGFLSVFLVAAFHKMITCDTSDLSEFELTSQINVFHNFNEPCTVYIYILLV
jgi:hypothetical protein